MVVPFLCVAGACAGARSRLRRLDYTLAPRANPVLMKVNAPTAAGKADSQKKNGHSNFDYRVPARSLLPRRMGGNQQKGD
jgi:hypothetical protein